MIGTAWGRLSERVRQRAAANFVPQDDPARIGGALRESEADLAARHICLFVGRHEERWEAFRPFFLKHFYAGKPTIYIHSASTREEIMDRVRDEGLDPHELNRRGLLTLIAAQDAYLKNPTFTPEFAVAFMRLQIIRKRADNHPSHLLCGEMDWFFTNAPGVESMHDYETALNDLLVEHPQTTIVCQYDLSRFAGIDVMKACCSHPAVVYRKRLYRAITPPPTAGRGGFSRWIRVVALNPRSRQLPARSGKIGASRDR